MASHRPASVPISHFAFCICSAFAPARPPRSQTRPRSAFSLLEVILALTILVGALVVLGELVRLGTLSAAGARDLTQAQLLCESKMSEILAGISAPEPVRDVPFDLDPDWLFSVEIAPIDAPGVVALRVSVMQNLAPNLRPAQFAIVRLIQDPGISLPTEEATAAEQTSTSAS